MRSVISILFSLALFVFVQASDADRAALDSSEEDGLSKRASMNLQSMRFGKRAAPSQQDELDELLQRLAEEEDIVRQIRSSPLGTMRFGKRDSNGPLTSMRFGKRSAPLASMRFGRR